LRSRAGAVTGILNGIDTAVWGPANDPHLAERYDVDSLEKKQANKRALQGQLNLEPSEELLVGFIGRLTDQKGADLLAAVAAEIAALPAQLAVLGRGERDIEGALAAAAARHPRSVAVAIGFNEDLAHLIEAGADAFLMPSRYEPCGLGQMHSLRYGTIPIVRRTGGLADSVVDATPEAIAARTATGVAFTDPSANALADAIRRARELYRDRNTWRDMQRTGMAQDFSWKRSAKTYRALHEQADSSSGSHRKRIN
jgi:starch synthase